MDLFFLECSEMFSSEHGVSVCAEYGFGQPLIIVGVVFLFC